MDIDHPEEDVKNPTVPSTEKSPAQKLEEDLAEEMDLIISRMAESNTELRASAIAQLRSKLYNGEESVTSLPKSIKYVRAKIETLIRVYTEARDCAPLGASESTDFLKNLADLLSFIMTTFPSTHPMTEKCGSPVHWKLLGDTAALAPWGHEFVRHLTADMVRVYIAEGFPQESLNPLIESIIAFEFAHNGETQAVDFVLEIGELERILPFLTETNLDGVGRYLRTIAGYLPKGEDVKLFGFIGDAYSSFGYAIEAARLGLRVGDIEKVRSLLRSKEIPVPIRVQIAHVCAVHGGVLNVDFLDALVAEESAETLPDIAFEGEHEASKDSASILHVLRNADREQYLQHVAQRLDLRTPKKTSDVLKSHSDHSSSLYASLTGLASRGSKSKEWTNLAQYIVDGLSNAACGEGSVARDAFESPPKGHRSISAIGSLGLLHLWRNNEALNSIDAHYSSEDSNIKAGAALAIGASFSGCPCAEFDPAYSMLADNIPRSVLVGDSVCENSKMVRMTSILGLGIAQAGTMDRRITDALVPIIMDPEEDIDVQGFSALAIGLVFIGSMHQDTIEALTLALMERQPEEIQSHTSIMYMILGLAMLFFGHREEADTMIMTTKTFPPAIQEFTEIAISSLAYSGTGNVMQIQRFLHHVIPKAASLDENEVKPNASPNTESDQSTEMLLSTPNANTQSASTVPSESSGEKKDSLSDKELMNQILGAAPMESSPSPAEGAQNTDFTCYSSKAIAVVGIGLIAMAEDVGADMCKRMMDHILQFGGLEARRGIPLSLAFMSISDPSVTVLESLSKLSHDSDEITAQNAIIGIGFVAAGTCNSRAITTLRALNTYYAKDEKFLFLCHFSMGLVSLGKGLMTLSPLHSERFLTSKVSLAGLLVVAYTMLDPSRTVFDQYHFMLLASVMAIRPRYLLTVDTALTPCDMTVRVGTSVDTVATVGKLKRVTGFQTFKTPALMAVREGAEIPSGANDPEMVSLAPVLEGVVLVQKVMKT
ncbi:26S proteasome regulatory non-ATPase subunit [Perkinsela sp. CCAP 1560/4]|nr:26S proteasome regulatory non-ATPase subunit [Perkinsela sp. CCAP 1560/4]|eukprot:KNH07500.1 26S proteasome regulatory non-ATPase subunit [Perkinsela sp. CCAP 1560/4]